MTCVDKEFVMQERFLFLRPPVGPYLKSRYETKSETDSHKGSVNYPY